MTIPPDHSAVDRKSLRKHLEFLILSEIKRETRNKVEIYWYSECGGKT